MTQTQTDPNTYISVANILENWGPGHLFALGLMAGQMQQAGDVRNIIKSDQGNYEIPGQLWETYCTWAQAKDQAPELQEFLKTINDQMDSVSSLAQIAGDQPLLPRQEFAVLQRINGQLNHALQELRDRKSRVQNKLNAWATILELDPQALTVRVPQPSNRTTIANSIFAFLMSSGETLHYREIYNRMKAENLLLPGGKDPAHTIISHIKRDRRFERRSPGCYRAVDASHNNLAHTI